MTMTELEFPFAYWRDITVDNLEATVFPSPAPGFHSPIGETSLLTAVKTYGDNCRVFPFAYWRDITVDRVKPLTAPFRLFAFPFAYWRDITVDIDSTIIDSSWNFRFHSPIGETSLLTRFRPTAPT